MQFVQYFHPDDFTVGFSGLFSRFARAKAGGPLQAVGLQQHPSTIDVVWVNRRAHPEVGHTRNCLRVQPMHLNHKDAAGGWLPVFETQVQCTKPQGPRCIAAERSAQFAAMHHVARNAVGPAQQAGRVLHIAFCQSRSDRRAGNPCPVHFVTVHAGYVKTGLVARCIQRSVITGPFGAVTKIVTHQYVLCPQPFDQHVIHKGLGIHGSQSRVERQHHHLVNSAGGQVDQLVAQGADTRRGQVGLTSGLRKIIPRMRFKGEHTTGQATLACFVTQQGQHRLVTPVHAIKVADGQRAGSSNARMFKTAKHFHEKTRRKFITGKTQF